MGPQSGDVEPEIEAEPALELAVQSLTLAIEGLGMLMEQLAISLGYLQKACEPWRMEWPSSPS